jgi:hypothetical protein
MNKKPPDQSAITLEGLLDAAQARGLLINKLGQFEDGWWRASVNDGEQIYEFGEGKTAFEALLAALKNAKPEMMTTPQQAKARYVRQSLGAITRDAGRPMATSKRHTATVLLTNEHLHKMIEDHLLQENELSDQSKVARVVQQLVNTGLGLADRSWRDWDEWAKGLE